MLSLYQVRKTYGAHCVLNDITLDIPGGSIVAVLGGSGAGKSTLLRLINRLITPDAGRIVCDGLDVTRLSGSGLRAWRARCGMVFQNFNLCGRLDAVTNVLTGALNRTSLPAALLGLFSPADYDEAMCLLDRLGVADVALRRAECLSGGQQQRVALARTLMQRPQIILADEPIAALDPHNAVIVMEALRAAAGLGITVICNLHQPETAVRYCDRIIGLRDGHVLFDGTPHSFNDNERERLYRAAPGRHPVNGGGPGSGSGVPVRKRN